MEMDLLHEILQQIINGIVMGGVYALVALGLTLIFGVLRIINFAHGEFYMMGAYFGLVISKKLGLPYLVTLVLAIGIITLIGICVERIIFRPIRGRDPINSIISSFGLSIFLQSAALHIFGPQPDIIPFPFGNTIISFWGLSLTLQRLVIPLFAFLLVASFHLLIKRTWLGITIRAVSQNLPVSMLMGIDINKVARYTFAIGSALAGVAGILIGTTFLLQPTMGNMVVLKSFTVVILGGMGNFYGAAGAGLLLGITEALTAGFITSDFKDIFAFVLVIIVILFRPEGIFARRGETYETYE